MKHPMMHAMLTGLSLMMALTPASSFAVEAAPAEDLLIPYVNVFPMSYDFGTTRYSQTTYITFQNNSGEPAPFFNAYCSGDFRSFDCSSNCFNLPQYGSCNVRVTFTPSRTDGSRSWVTVYGQGSGAFATAQVYGTEPRE